VPVVHEMPELNAEKRDNRRYAEVLNAERHHFVEIETRCHVEDGYGVQKDQRQCAQDQPDTGGHR